MKLFIASSAKSGTHYTTNFLNQLGIKVEHENHGIDGIVTWMLNQVPNENEFIVLHQTRHPLEAISSCMNLNKESWRYIRKELLITKTVPLLKQCMEYWYEWNKSLDNCTFTYPVEDIEELINILDLFKFPTSGWQHISVPEENWGLSDKKINLTWDDLEDENKLLARAIKRLAKKYGYN